VTGFVEIWNNSIPAYLMTFTLPMIFQLKKARDLAELSQCLGDKCFLTTLTIADILYSAGGTYITCE